MFNRPVVSFYADYRSRTDGKLSIKLSLFYQNGTLKERKKISLKLFYTQKEWDIIKDRNNQKGTRGVIFGQNLINERAKINFVETRINEIIDEYLKRRTLFSLDDIKNDFLDKPTNSITRIYLTNLFDEIIQVKQKAGKALSTVNSYEWGKKSFVKYITDELNLDPNKFRITEIDASWVQGYFDTNTGIRETTRYDYIISLRTVFNYAISENLIDPKIYPFDEKNIDNYFNIQASARTKRALTEEEFNKFKLVKNQLTIPQKEAWTYFMLSYLFNGANLKDIAELRYSDIDNFNNTIIFRRKKTAHRKKIDKDIVVQLTPQIERIIEDYANSQSKKADNYIFPIYPNEKLTKEEKTKIVKAKTHSWGKKWNLIAKKADVRSDLTYQMARHTYATLAVKHGVSIEEISKSMGHTSIEQTKEYIDTLPVEICPQNEIMKEKTVPLDIFD